MKKKIMTVLLFTLTLMMTVGLTSCGSKEQSRLDKIRESGELVVATSPDFPPYEFENLSGEGETYAGSDIELAKYIAEQLGVELKIEAMNFNAVQTAISTGSVDMAISGLAYTEERALSMDMSDFYNVETDDGQGVLVRSEDAAGLKTAEDFNGKIVAAQNGALQYTLVEKQLPDATIEPVSSLKDAILMLQNGKVDAVAVSGDNGLMFTENYEGIEMSEFYFDYSTEGNVVAVTKGETELLEEVNRILKEVEEKGLYQKWLDEAYALAEELGIEIEE